MKRAQALDPAHRTQPLAWLYSMLLMQSSDPRRAKASPAGLQIRHELQASNDIVMVGAVARYVAGMSTEKSPANNELKAIAEELIKHAEALDPQSSEWPALMERVLHVAGVSPGTQGGSVVSPIAPQNVQNIQGSDASVSITPQLMRVSKEMASSALLDSETPAYPPEAQAIRLHGTAIVQVRISKDGHVTEAKALSGHPLLIQPAIEAVKHYVYKPFMLNGNAVDVSTIVEVRFRE
jgi:protein TonB